ncbi:MAG: hypothetical protein FJY34_12570 [Betaproteobacteria bacterium]|nr:hypothetical protein [Betaproteobacteria bacterium]
MSHKAASEYRGEAAAAAFDRVLEAERTAEAEVATCREQATALVAGAAEGRRGLQADVDARIAAWQVRLARKADQAVAVLEREAAGLGGAMELDATDRQRIGRAVARLADELIAGD